MIVDNNIANLYLYNYSDSTIMPTVLTGPSYKQYYFYIDAINVGIAVYQSRRIYFHGGASWSCDTLPFHTG